MKLIMERNVSAFRTFQAAWVSSFFFGLKRDWTSFWFWLHNLIGINDATHPASYEKA